MGGYHIKLLGFAMGLDRFSKEKKHNDVQIILIWNSCIFSRLPSGCMAHCNLIDLMVFSPSQLFPARGANILQNAMKQFGALPE